MVFYFSEGQVFGYESHTITVYELGNLKLLIVDFREVAPASEPELNLALTEGGGGY